MLGSKLNRVCKRSPWKKYFSDQCHIRGFEMKFAINWIYTHHLFDMIKGNTTQKYKCHEKLPYIYHYIWVYTHTHIYIYIVLKCRRSTFLIEIQIYIYTVCKFDICVSIQLHQLWLKPNTQGYIQYIWSWCVIPETNGILHFVWICLLFVLAFRVYYLATEQ